MSHSGYHNPTFASPRRYASALKRVAVAARKARRKYGIQLLAFAGMSGSALAFPVGASCNLKLAYVRKPKENSHGTYEIEAADDYRTAPYAFIDDFIGLGKTYELVVGRMGRKPECIILRTGDRNKAQHDGVPIIYSGVRNY